MTAAARDPAFLAGVEAELGVEAQTVASNPPFERQWLSSHRVRCEQVSFNEPPVTTMVAWAALPQPPLPPPPPPPPPTDAAASPGGGSSTDAALVAGAAGGASATWRVGRRCERGLFTRHAVNRRRGWRAARRARCGPLGEAPPAGPLRRARKGRRRHAGGGGGRPHPSHGDVRGGKGVTSFLSRGCVLSLYKSALDGLSVDSGACTVQEKQTETLCTKLL